MPQSTENKILALVAHLGFLTGVGFIIAPLLIWLLKKDSPFVAHHAKQALIWQGATAVVGAVYCTGGFVLSFFTGGLAAILLVPFSLALGLLMMVPAVIAAVKVFENKEYLYPLTGGWANSL